MTKDIEKGILDSFLLRGYEVNNKKYDDTVLTKGKGFYVEHLGFDCTVKFTLDISHKPLESTILKRRVMVFCNILLKKSHHEIKPRSHDIKTLGRLI